MSGRTDWEREEAERLRLEEERQQRLAQEEALQQALCEKVAAEALIQSSNASGVISMEGVESEIGAGDTEQPDLSGENETTEQPEADAPVERIYAVLRGNRVDITGLGVDPEGLPGLGVKRFGFNYLN